MPKVTQLNWRSRIQISTLYCLKWDTQPLAITVLLCLNYKFFTFWTSEPSFLANSLYNISEMKNGEIIQALLQIFLPLKLYTIFCKLYNNRNVTSKATFGIQLC